MYFSGSKKSTTHTIQFIGQGFLFVVLGMYNFGKKNSKQEKFSKASWQNAGQGFCLEYVLGIYNFGKNFKTGKV